MVKFNDLPFPLDLHKNTHKTNSTKKALKNTNTAQKHCCAGNPKTPRRPDDPHGVKIQKVAAGLENFPFSRPRRQTTKNPSINGGEKVPDAFPGIYRTRET